MPGSRRFEREHTRLLDAQFVESKGLVVTFEVTGKFNPLELKGRIYVYGEKSFPLHYAFKDNADDTRLACVSDDGLRDYAGKGALVQFADIGLYLADGTIVEIGKSYHDFETFAKRLIRDWFGYNNVADINFIFLGCESKWW